MLTNSQKKYLLTIYLLGQNGEKVRITDVASFLGVAKASTVRMMEKLTDEGYISKQPYKQIGLTGKGVAEANRMFTPSVILQDFFATKVGLPHEKASSAAMLISADLDNEALDKFVCFALSQQEVQT